MSSSSDEKNPKTYVSSVDEGMKRRGRNRAVIVPLALLFTFVFLLLFGLVIGGDYLRRRLLAVEDEVDRLKVSYKTRSNSQAQETQVSRSKIDQDFKQIPSKVDKDQKGTDSAANKTILAAPSIHVSPKSLTVKMGHQEKLYCHMSGALPKADITWNRRDGGLGGIQVKTSETSKLLINRATFRDAGIYFCRAQNALGTAEEAVEVVLEVTVKAYHRVELECPVIGDIASLKWTKEKGEIPKGHTHIEQDKLVFDAVHAEDSGTYVCTVRNLSARIKLTVNENDCTVFDFEHGIDGWEKTGSVFNNQPTYGDNPTARNRGQPSNHQGDYWIGGAEHRPSPQDTPGKWQWDGPQGTLTSPPFKIKGRTIKFLIGGGCDMSVVRAELVVNERVVRRETGECNETMKEKFWNVRDLQGKMARLRLIDHSSKGWGHINFDYMRETCDRG